MKENKTEFLTEMRSRNIVFWRHQQVIIIARFNIIS